MLKRMILLYVLLLLIPVIIYSVKTFRKKASFFKDRGIKYEEPVFFFGNSLPFVLGKKHQAELFEDLCKANLDEPIVGFFEFMQPHIIVQNADYIEKILIKDFTCFTDHGFDDLIEKTRNPFDESLFLMTGNKWRAFRYKMSPIFTSGKLKSMFSSMTVNVDSLNEFLKNKPHNGYEIKEAAGLFAFDVIGSSIFGIDVNLLKNSDSEYYRLGKKAFDSGKLDFFKFVLLGILPGFIIRWLGWSFNKKEVIKYFSKVVMDTINYRRNNNIQRNDMIQLLLQLREKQTIEISNWDSNDDYLQSKEVMPSSDKFEVTDEVITVQAFTFLIGGFDSLSLTTMYTCFDLSQNPEIQEKARLEILEQVKLHSGLTYEAVKNMTYLENVVKESLRLHPVIPGLMRVCTKDYTFPNGYTIHKSETIQIPALVVHMNPNYFSEPESFKPERFEDTIKPGTYFPFGDGPRVCLALRYALLHVKIGVATILMNYRLKLNKKTALPLKYKTSSFFRMPTEPILFDLEEIDLKA